MSGVGCARRWRERVRRARKPLPHGTGSSPTTSHTRTLSLQATHLDTLCLWHCCEGPQVAAERRRWCGFRHCVCLPVSRLAVAAPVERGVSALARADARAMCVALPRCGAHAKVCRVSSTGHSAWRRGARRVSVAPGLVCAVVACAPRSPLPAYVCCSHSVLFTCSSARIFALCSCARPFVVPHQTRALRRADNWQHWALHHTTEDGGRDGTRLHRGHH